jgi:DNA repair exonuclease SbcCD ATPase subunit
MATKELRVTGLHVKDVLGVAEMKMEPGKVTLLKGKNASGKSTLLSSLQAALGRGSLAKFARIDPAGAETSPEVVLVLDGGPGEHYRVERTGDNLRVRKQVGTTAALEDVPRPQEFLAGLYDPTCSNPVRFLTAPDKERALLLLEALPLKMDRAALLSEMGVEAKEIGQVPTGLHPLEEIGLIRANVFAARTGVNRDEKAAAQAADQLRRNIPAALAEDPAAAIAALEKRTTALADQVARAEEGAASDFEKASAAARAEHAQAEAKVRADHKEAARSKRAAFDAWEADERVQFERRVAQRKSEVEAEVATSRETSEWKLGEIDSARDAVLQAAEADRTKALAGLAALRNNLTGYREQLVALRAQADRLSKDKALTEQAEVFDRDRARLEEESERLTKALDALDAYRRRMAENLPISGLTIEGKEIRVNGIPFEQLNTQARIDIAVQVASLRAKGSKLPVIFVDGAEALDAEHFEALVARLAQENLQAFVARVEDHDLAVVNA